MGGLYDAATLHALTSSSADSGGLSVFGPARSKAERVRSPSRALRMRRRRSLRPDGSVTLLSGARGTTRASLARAGSRNTTAESWRPKQEGPLASTRGTQLNLKRGRKFNGVYHVGSNPSLRPCDLISTASLTSGANLAQRQTLREQGSGTRKRRTGGRDANTRT